MKEKATNKVIREDGNSPHRVKQNNIAGESVSKVQLGLFCKWQESLLVLSCFSNLIIRL